MCFNYGCDIKINIETISGSDSACEAGCDLARGRKSIYLPFMGFNGSDSKFYRIKKDAEQLASTVVGHWDNLE